MMTPAQLERGSQAFRRGYRDRHANRPANLDDYPHNSFSAYDYEEGWKAAEAELRFDLFDRGDVSDDSEPTILF